VIAVVGVGNAYRGDDAAGLRTAEVVRRALPEGVAVVTTEEEPTRLLDLLADAEAAFLVDAVSSGAEPGTLHRLDVTREELPEALFRGSTHHFSLGDTIELARTLGQLPPTAIVFGIEGESFTASDELTPAVARAVEAAAAKIVAEVNACTSARS
jgi:hydrogenase maturation protease